MWHFRESDENSTNVKDPTESTVQPHGEDLTPLGIFTREILQNAVDNPSPSNSSGKVKVNFTLHELSGSAKGRFLDAIGFDEIAAHLDSARKEQLANNSRTLLPPPEDIKSPEYVLKVLVIEDFGTRGLVGPERQKEKEAFKAEFSDIPHCFLGLCRNVGDSQKSGVVAGGTHGFGKTVLWKNSRIKTVLFYSNLDQPYYENGHEHHARFFGQVRLPGHYRGDEAYQGEGYFGKLESKLTRSLYDQTARDTAAKLGIPVRDNDAKGTTIIVVDFDDPDQLEDETSARTASGLKSFAERYFWPAIVTGRLEVNVGWTTAKKSPVMELAEPQLRVELSPFVKLYKTMVEKEIDANNIVKVSEIEIPKGPSGEAAGVACLAIGVRLNDNEGTHGGIPPKNSVALIRGAGMVVGYWNVPRRGLAAKNYYAVALGGLACPQTEVVYDKEHFEKLLAWAEPVTHDSWTPNAEALKGWYRSQATVKRVRASITDSISDLTTTTIKPEGDAAPLLAGMFPLDVPDSVVLPDPRDIHIEVAGSPHMVEVGSDGRPRYGFSVKVTVPQRQKFRSKAKPDNWRLVCSYRFLGEGRHRKIVEQVQTRFTALRIDGGNWEEIGNTLGLHSVYDGAVIDKQASYELRGETTPLDPNMAFVAKHDLAVELYRGYKE
jgi:RNA polymerase primary sigma factor